MSPSVRQAAKHYPGIFLAIHSYDTTHCEPNALLLTAVPLDGSPILREPIHRISANALHGQGGL